MVFDYRPLAPDIGVEIRGLDPTRLDRESIAAFREAFDKYHMVLLRGVDITEEQQSNLTETLGEVCFESPVMRKGGERKFSFIGNQHSDSTLRDGELLFHSDHSFFKLPLKAIALYSLAAPLIGGETVFINAGAAYRRLPQPLKDRIDGLEARHIASYGAFEGDARPRFDPTSKAKVAVHPVVWTHPDSGEKILFVSRLLTESILGMSHENSESLLEELFAYIEDPTHQYAHKWMVGDYLVWDNRQLQHSRRDFDPTEKRALRRVPIAQPEMAA
jgi:alpha-ketoglutarate-dependent taurine dioxygenase